MLLVVIKYDLCFALQVVMQNQFEDSSLLGYDAMLIDN